MLHSRKLLYINEIARTGSIRKAAAKLNVASSAINRQIIALEEEIGMPLFERLPRGLRLTAAGELYVEHIRDVLKNYQRLNSRVRALKMPDAGKVQIVSTIGLAAGPLPVIVRKFIAEHPRVKIFMRNDGGSTTMNPVYTGEVDIGIGFNIPATPGVRTLAAFEIPIGAVLPPQHPLTRKKSVSLAEVLQERLILIMPGTSLRDVIDFAFAPLSAPIEPVIETNSTETVKQFVAAGTGVTLMNPLDVINECGRGELVYRPLSDGHVRPQQLKVFARARAPLDSAGSLFVEFLLSELAIMVETLEKSGAIPASQTKPALQPFE